MSLTVVRSASVLGQAHTPRRRLLPFAAIGLAVLVAPAVGGANPSHSVSTLRAQDAVISAKSRSAVLGLYALDSRLATANAQLRSLHDSARTLRAARTGLELQLRVARRSTAVAERALAQQVRVLYEDGNVEPIEILFGARSLDDAMTSIDNLSRVSKQGEEVLAELKAAKQRLAGAERELALRESALSAATRAARATAAALAERSPRAHDVHRLTRLEAAHDAARDRMLRWLPRRRRSAAPIVARAAPAPVPVVMSERPDVAVATSIPAGRTITVVATGYALGGRTATGLPVGWGVAAVDPSVIPLGTHMTIPGYGEAVAADVGGAVSGNDDRPLVPDGRAGERLGPPHRHDRSALVPSTLRCPVPPPRQATADRERIPTARSPDPRVLLVDDHDLFRTGLRNLLEEQGVQIAGECDNGTDALRAVRELAPDVVVMDLNMPGISGVEATRQISMIAPLTRVLVLTISDQDADVMDAILAGACGYLLKDASIDELMQGIRGGRGRRVARLADDRGEGAAARAGVGRVAREAEVIRSELSDREIQVLKLIANGKDNAMIAAELHISPKTVKNHISNILMKLQIENRIQAAVYAVRSGIV